MRLYADLRENQGRKLEETERENAYEGAISDASALRT